MEGAYLQCVNNHYAKFAYIGINTVGVTDYTNLLRHPLSIADEKKIWHVHKIEDEHIQYVNNH